MAAPSLAWVGATSSTTTDPDPAFPASAVQSGDKIFVINGLKAATGGTTPATPNTPSGWTQVFNAAGGTGTSGVDTGPIRITVFQRNTDANGTENGTTLTNLIANPEGAGSVMSATLFGVRPSRFGSTFSLSESDGQDTTSGTAYSVTVAADVGITIDDLLLAFAGVDNSTTSSFSAESITATGATISASTESFDTGTTSGNHIRTVLWWATCTAGASSAAATIAATSAGSVTGVGALLRISEIGGGPFPGSPLPRFAPGQGPSAWTRFPRPQQGSIVVVSAPDQTITATGVVSEERIGEPFVTQQVAATGISTVETSGASTLTATATISTTAVSTSEAVGQPAITSVISATGILSTEQFGAITTTVVVAINATSIQSAERFGSIATSASATISPTGILSAEIFGNGTSTLFISAAGIATAEQFGLANVTIPVTLTITAAGIRSGEQFGIVALTIVVAEGIQLSLTTWVLSYRFTPIAEIGFTASVLSYRFTTVAEEADIADIPSWRVTTGVGI